MGKLLAGERKQARGLAGRQRLQRERRSCIAAAGVVGAVHHVVDEQDRHLVPARQGAAPAVKLRTCADINQDFAIISYNRIKAINA